MEKENNIPAIKFISPTEPCVATKHTLCSCLCMTTKMCVPIRKLMNNYGCNSIHTYLGGSPVDYNGTYFSGGNASDGLSQGLEWEGQLAISSPG